MFKWLVCTKNTPQPVKWLDLEIAIFNLLKSADYACFLMKIQIRGSENIKSSSSQHHFATPAVESSPITHKAQI